jgi:hypothetical protein
MRKESTGSTPAALAITDPTVNKCRHPAFLNQPVISSSFISPLTCRVRSWSKNAAVLRAPNQLCYYVFIFALFVIYFVCNVSATISYEKKELLDIRTAITHLGLGKTFSSTSRTHRMYFRHPTRPTSQLLARETDAGTEDTERGAS